MRRLPITSLGNGLYEFPALNGFSYRLKFNNALNNAALTNFENILSMNSNFMMKGKAGLPRKLEPSPDDKLMRHHKEKETGPTEVIKEVIKQGIEKVKHVKGSLKSAPKKLTSTKKRMDLKTLKNKNFKKTAKPTFKKDFFDQGEKLTNEFMEKRKKNPNLMEMREFKDLAKTSDSIAPTVYLYRVEIEEAILNNKDLIQQGNYKLSDDMILEKKGFMESIKQGIHDIKESVSGMMGHSHERAQERAREGQKDIKIDPKTGVEMHYQG